MKNLKIRYKVLLPMLALLTVVTGGSLYLLYSMSEINQQSNIISDEWLPRIETTMDMNLELSSYRRAQMGILLSNNKTDEEKQLVIMQTAEADFEVRAKTYETKFITTEEGRKLYNEFDGYWEAYKKETAQIFDLKNAGQTDLAIQQILGAGKTYTNATGIIEKIVAINLQRSADTSAHADDLYAKDKLLAIGTIILLIVFGLVIVHLLVNAVAKPVAAITAYMNYLASGSLDKDVPSRELKDEIGDMARSVQVFKDNMVRAKELEAAEVKERAAKEVRQKKVDAATEKFEHAMTDIVKFVASASTELQASAQSLAASAEETSKQSGAVAAASQQAAANVQTVASASEELSSSINEISSQVARSSQVAGRAVTDARAAGVSVGALVEAAQRIGDVTKMISDIAEQTNLLALNATIEAARAGDAGKGFAVVASEVKNLANESAKATEQIASQIASIQTISQESADSINAICKIIEEMDEISGSISAAIQEQTAATQEISRNVTEAYTGTSEVTQNIGNVSEAADTTGAASHEVLAAADELSRQSSILKKEFDDFIKTVAAA